ncbi:phosphohistidine phosphatase SixA [Nitrincola alkalilacustris]|uniref:phosphohistidine phosphatase SixA n=1 Tax=Nitrincola alkalilacustris TaxID=1571224 RepID=UPI00124F0DFF|nr:phosphohistidine phosphatase SixA [Nitrincola alkalilacustris]
MRLLLIRHGEAMPWSPSGDAGRELSANGRQEVISVREQIPELLSSVSLVLHSPYVRAMQTAELLAEGLQVPSVALDALVPDSTPILACEALEAYVPNEPLLIVTHQPLIGCWVNWLCDGNRSQLSWATAQLAVVETDWPAGNMGRLLASYYPA